MHATNLKGIVGDFKGTVFQRNLKESYGRPLIYVCECWRKVTKVGLTATVVRNSVLIISNITFRDCRVHFTLDKLSRNSCVTNEAVGRVGYYQLISGKSEKNNCFSKFSSNSLRISSGETSSNRDTFFTDAATKKIFPTFKISAQEIRHQFFLIWSNLMIMAHIMGLGNQSESWKIIILS